MKTFRWLANSRWLLAATMLVALSVGAADPATDSGKTRVLLVTGGHDYEREPFLAIFKSFSDVSFKHVEHPKAQAFFEPESAKSFDVLVLYDMWQKIDEATKTNFLKLFQSGKGVVVLHHAIANYNEWDPYAEIIGARYYLQPKTVNGVEKARSVWLHDVEHTIHIADPAHPVTKGIKDFPIHDETYNLFDVVPGVKLLLTTEEPTSNKIIAWAKDYEKSRLVYIQLGHDHFAFDNPNYRQLVLQAIRWTARKD